MSKTQTQAQSYKRSGNKWTVNECLRLEREYDLLKLSVPEIALLHERSSDAIMYKLDQEGIADFNQLYIIANPTTKATTTKATTTKATTTKATTTKAANSRSDVSVTDDDSESDNDDGSNYEESDASDEDDEEYEEEEEEECGEEVDEKYNAYDLSQQVRTLTKQLANLTAVVYKSFTGKTNNLSFH